MNFLPLTSPPWFQRARTLLGRLLVAGLIVGSGAGIGHAVATNPSWRVSDVRFVGADHAPEGELRHLSDLRQGDHLLTLDLDHAIDGVRRHPWVRSATARRVFPGTVEITVSEHEPVLLLALDRLWYVDSDGVAFAPATSDDLDYPALTGLDPELASSDPELGRAAVAGALRVLTTWTARDRDGGAREVSEIFFSPTHGFDLVLRSGTRLLLGVGDPAEPLTRLDRLIGAGLDLGVPQRVDLDMKTVAVATPLPARPGARAPMPTADPLAPSSPTSSLPLSSPTDPGPQGGSVLGGTSHD